MILNNGTSLAYLGDSVYELHIRTYLLSKGSNNVKVLHNEAIKYTSGVSQAKIIKKMLEDNILTEEEIDYYKRGRNADHSANRRAISMTEYKMATGFEALIGYLHLTKKEKRLEEIIELAIKIVEVE